MSTVRWTGKATAVAQVDTFTPGGTIEADDIFILTVTGWDGTSTTISVAAGGTGASDVVTALKTAWNASTNALCTPITASGTATLILTADTAGVPFSVAGSTTEANGTAADAQTFSKASTVASAGPLHWDSAGNWSGGAVPVDDDHIYIEDWSADILYGLNQSGITADSLNIGKTFTGAIGYAGAAGYAGTYLQIEPDVVNIGYYSGTGNPSGATRIMLDTEDTATTINVDDAGTSEDTNKPCIRIKAAAAGTTINVKKGTVGIAYESGETTTVGTININYVSNKSSDATVEIGSGTTLTTLTKTGGVGILKCAATTVTNNGGTLKVYGSGAYTTVNVGDGTVTNYGSGTITTLNLTGNAKYIRAATHTITNLPVNAELKVAS
jgi:hypothetical protein